ncbi:hypothetical protein HY640_00790 [Candidatus Woesearchaeota archaeon]|nr:hypothetical protein [Candidatus Woesearchaeota archaeon]
MKLPDFGKIVLRLFGNVTRKEHLLLQEFKVSRRSPLKRKTKMELVRDTGTVIMGIKKTTAKRYTMNMPFNTRINQGSILVLGTNKQLNELEKYTRAKNNLPKNL